MDNPDEQPFIHLRRRSRWIWYAYVTIGLRRLDGDLAFTRTRAIAKARQRYARWARGQADEAAESFLLEEV